MNESNLSLEDVDAVVAEHAAFDSVEKSYAIPLVIFQRHQTRAVGRANPLCQRTRHAGFVVHDLLQLVQDVRAHLGKGEEYGWGGGDEIKSRTRDAEFVIHDVF